MILFSDLSFIFRFLPVMLAAYWLTPAKYRHITLFTGSMIFYALGDLVYLPVLLLAAIFNYLLSEGCYRKHRSFLVVSIGFDVVLLAVFKLLAGSGSIDHIPPGISFYLFKMISFQADLYRGRIKERISLVRMFNYFILFNQVMSGPIMRYEDMGKSALNMELRVPEILLSVEEGIKVFTAGLCLKVLLADTFAVLWNDLGTIGYESISTPLAWVGAAGYSLELYFDFWGYSLMSAGIGLMLGLPFVRNFEHPYAASGVADYYRRWHMTLGGFFRDYVYIPLGGSRQGKGKTCLNLAAVWLLTGLWHGITVNFLIWAFLLYLMILTEKFLLVKLPDVIRNIWGRIHVLLIVPLTWVVFALTNLRDVIHYFSRLFPFFGEFGVVNPRDLAVRMPSYLFFFLIGILLLIPQVNDLIFGSRNKTASYPAVFMLFWICVFKISVSAGNPFMYLNF